MDIFHCFQYFLLRDALNTLNYYREAFKIFDRDKDGFISTKELKKVTTMLGTMLTKEEVDEFMAEADLVSYQRLLAKLIKDFFIIQYSFENAILIFIIFLGPEVHYKFCVYFFIIFATHIMLNVKQSLCLMMLHILCWLLLWCPSRDIKTQLSFVTLSLLPNLVKYLQAEFRLYNLIRKIIFRAL